MSDRDWDSLMLKVWVGVLVVCSVVMPVNVAAYLAGWINEKTLILITLVLSYMALQLSAAAAIVSAIGARRVKELAGS